jgi:hypothetical protein
MIAQGNVPALSTQLCMHAVQLGSVFRTVLLSLRTLLIWSANLAIYYANVGHGSLGEHWDIVASPIELLGFAVLVLGAVLYSQGSSAVARDTKTIVTDIKGMYRALSERSVESFFPCNGTLPSSDTAALSSMSGRASRAVPAPTAAASPFGETTTSASASDFENELREVMNSGILDGTFWTHRGTDDNASPGTCLEHASHLQDADTARVASLPGTAMSALVPSVPLCPDSCLPAGERRSDAVIWHHNPCCWPWQSRAQADHAGEGPHNVDETTESLLGRAVEMIGHRHNFSRRVKDDIHHELLLCDKEGITHQEPSIKGTFMATTSWVVPLAHADQGQHRGASSYQNPFFPQMLRSDTEMRLDAMPQVPLHPEGTDHQARMWANGSARGRPLQQTGREQQGEASAAATLAEEEATALQLPPDDHEVNTNTSKMEGMPALQSLGNALEGASQPGIGGAGTAVDGATGGAVARTPQRDLSFDLLFSSEQLTATMTSSSSEELKRVLSQSIGGWEEPAQPEG